MPAVSNVTEAVLYVSDLVRTRHFFESVLGLPVTLAFDGRLFFADGSRFHTIWQLISAETGET